MSSKTRGPWIERKSRVVYDNPWIRLEHHDVVTPAGTDGIYGVVHFKHKAVGIIPVDDQGSTWLVKQYRYTLNAYTWEIPMGGSPAKENLLLTAQRELEEETGYKAKKWTQIAMAHLSNSVSDEEGYVFLAEDLYEGLMCLEDTEDITVKRFPLEQAFAMAHDGRITDVLSVVGLLKLQLMMSQGEPSC